MATATDHVSAAAATMLAASTSVVNGDDHERSAKGSFSASAIDPSSDSSRSVALHGVITCKDENLYEWPGLVQRLCEQGVLREVPAEYLVPEQERPGAQPTRLNNSTILPVIDLAGLHSPHTYQPTLDAIDKACQDWGFFQVVNHGIPTSTIEGARQGARQFFEQPMEEKAHYFAKRDQSNIESLQGYGHTHFFKGRANDWMDSLFGYLHPSSLKNLDAWPAQPPSLRGMVDAYGYEAHKLFNMMLGIISTNLGREPTNLAQHHFQDFNIFFRANYYPPCPQPSLVLGTHGHKDHGALTILLQDKVNDGLQVFKDGEWFAVDPIPNALVINIGDKLQNLTNGKYKSALHRGVVSDDATIMTLVAHLDPPSHEVTTN